MRLHLGLGMVHALVENYKVRLLGLCAGNYTLLSLPLAKSGPATDITSYGPPNPPTRDGAGREWGENGAGEGRGT